MLGVSSVVACGSLWKLQRWKLVKIESILILGFPMKGICCVICDGFHVKLPRLDTLEVFSLNAENSISN